MSELDPAPVAEDTDEPGVRRSIRIRLIVMSTAMLLAMLGLLLARQLGHRPAGVHHTTSVWSLVLILAIMGITLVAMALLMRRLYRRPRYRRVMQYGWRRRWRVGKDLRRGRMLSAEDMPVAKALVELVGSQGRWVRFLYIGMALIYIPNGFAHHGFSRWLYWGLAACFLVLIPIVQREQRQMIRGYERQNTPTVGDHDGEIAAGGTA